MKNWPLPGVPAPFEWEVGFGPSNTSPCREALLYWIW